MLVDRLGTLGAPDGIDNQFVLHVCDAADVRHDAFHDAELLLRTYSPREPDDTGVDGYVDVIRIERELHLQLVTHERAQLVVGQLLGRSEVLVVLFHSSSGPPSRGAVLVTGRTEPMRPA